MTRCQLSLYVSRVHLRVLRALGDEMIDARLVAVEGCPHDRRLANLQTHHAHERQQGQLYGVRCKGGNRRGRQRREHIIRPHNYAGGDGSAGGSVEEGGDRNTEEVSPRRCRLLDMTRNHHLQLLPSLL